MTSQSTSAGDSRVEPPTVFVVDDDSESRTALQQLLQSVRLNVETFASADEFLARDDRPRCGCLVLDVRMPRMSGLELQQQLRERHAFLPIIFVTAYAEVSLAVEAMKAGAVDFVQKPYSPQELLDKIQHALAEDELRRGHWAECTSIAARLDSLTLREREVLKLLVLGKTTKEIAYQIGVSPTTADFHRRHVFEKTGTENAVQLAQLVHSFRLWQDRRPTAAPPDF
jgi:two-component system response regulator FixJ